VAACLSGNGAAHINGVILRLPGMADRVRVKFPVRQLSPYVTIHLGQLSVAIPSWVGANARSDRVPAKGR